MLVDLEYLYLTKNVSIGYHHYELNDGNVVDDLKVLNDDQQDDLDKIDVEVVVVVEEEVVVVVAVENVLVELEDDDVDGQDDEKKQMVLIAKMIEAKWKKQVLRLFREKEKFTDLDWWVNGVVDPSGLCWLYDDERDEVVGGCGGNPDGGWGLDWSSSWSSSSPDFDDETFESRSSITKSIGNLPFKQVI